MTQEAGKSKEEIVGKHSPGALFSLETVYMWMEEYAQQREQPWVRVDSGQMPEVGEWIIMHHDYGDREDLSMDRYNKNLARFLKDNQVTHWMRINPPAPPKEIK